MAQMNESKKALIGWLLIFGTLIAFAVPFVLLESITNRFWFSGILTVIAVVPSIYIIFEAAGSILDYKNGCINAKKLIIRIGICILIIAVVVAVIGFLINAVSPLHESSSHSGCKACGKDTDDLINGLCRSCYSWLEDYQSIDHLL